VPRKEERLVLLLPKPTLRPQHLATEVPALKVMLLPKEQLMLLLPQPIPKPTVMPLLKEEPQRVVQVLVHSHPARAVLLRVVLMVSRLVELLKEERAL